MTSDGPVLNRYHLVAGLGLVLCISLCAQEPTTSHASKAGSTNTPDALSPLHSGLPKAPVELFRSLLAMNSQERQAFLAKRSPETQKLILAKIQEYAALKPEQRDLRLRVTELRWYLLPLLNSPATNRMAQLNSVPEPVRSLIQDRLQQWDKLSSTAQKQVLENESIVSFYFEQSPARLDPRPAPVATIPEAAREQFEAGIRRWQALPEEQRREVVTHFNEFFHLTSAEQHKTLHTLSEPERLQIEKTLQTFEELTPIQRSQCLQSFQKFASLTPDERRQFLKNAERWELMTPSERQSWRNLVFSLSRQPPAPPGLGPPSLLQPPVLKMPPAGSSVATNSN
jgi:hypothetical protein